MIRPTLLSVAALFCAVTVGCASSAQSNTARTGTEQLLISNSIDQALDKVNFTPFNGYNVYLDSSFTESVDQKYLVSSVRHRLMASGAVLTSKQEDSEVTIELRAGAIGTDTSDSFVGMPAIALPGPVPVNLPEIKLVSRQAQFGTAKIGLFAYDSKTREALGTGGLASAQSDDNNWYLLGMGPWKNGNVRNEIEFANDTPRRARPLPRNVAFTNPSNAIQNGLDVPGAELDLLPVSNRVETPAPK